MTVAKFGGTKYTWSPGYPKLEGTRPTCPIGWLRLFSYGEWVEDTSNVVACRRL